MEEIVVIGIWFQKSAVLIHFAPETWNHAWCSVCADKSLVPKGRKQAAATEDFEFHISYL